ncbi:hypothetical protein PIB30_014063 [Stylosanthes scabra]|uniref:DYW domain-containing protein n=1 Tax=Stylosanthes scabra TaxID=79078 RepID=A0ABU6Q7B5_9FABA|nr:hypothetical protein [Stylosanthes scabra]
MCGYLQNGDANASLVLFSKMGLSNVKPNEFTLSTARKASIVLGVPQNGMQIHCVCAKSSFDSAPVVGNSIIDMYSKCGRVDEAARMFDAMPVRNLVSWNAMIAGYTHERNGEEALNLFREMQEKGEVPDEYTYSSTLKACSCIGVVAEGSQIHASLIRQGSSYLAQSTVAGALVDFYVKCRRIAEARRVFDQIEHKNVGKQMHAFAIKVPYGLEASVANSVLDMYIVSWTVMITGYGKHGIGYKAVKLFDEMQVHGIEPDSVTYLAVLSACSHAGLIKEGQQYFSGFCSNPHSKPKVEHYACMVDLLGRSGRLKEAKELIEKIPFKPNTGHWNESEKIREKVKRKGLKKEAGRSWVEINKEIHIFYNGDSTHPLIEKIHQVLKEMEKRMNEEIGYVHNVNFALHDVEEESKVESLRYHSEKLAIGLVLVSGGVKGERMVRIFKNLRVCGDCHTFIKGVSKVLKIVFVVRDANRFHRFENGLRSCGDYW